MALTPVQDAYLKAHRQGILGTGKRDGSPQLSMINYIFDGDHFWISVTSDRAKWLNSLRQPKVSLLVPEGRAQVIVYGTSEGITDSATRNAMTRRLRAGGPNAAPDDEAEFDRLLNEQRRVILKVTPTQVLGEGS